MVRYFEWMGSAIYTADHRAGAMHGKQFLLDSVHAGIDETNVYGRLDFKGAIPDMQFEIVVNLESWAEREARPRKALRLDAVVQDRRITEWKVRAADDEVPFESSEQPGAGAARVALLRNFEFRVPLAWSDGRSRLRQPSSHHSLAATRLRLRLSLWQNRLPVDALPLEGWIELHLLEEGGIAVAVLTRAAGNRLRSASLEFCTRCGEK